MGAGRFAPRSPRRTASSVCGRSLGGPAVAVAVLLAGGVAAQDGEAYKRTWSQRPYVHHLELKDAAGRPVDPGAERPEPYSPAQTCKTCHDVARMGHGLHSNAALDPSESVGVGAEQIDAWRASDRAGEPWIYVDPRSGTVLPVSLRPGRDRAYSPAALGLEPLDLIRLFGRHAPGGGRGAVGLADEAPRVSMTGAWDLDCMACHAAGQGWSHEHWADQLAADNLRWAPTAALGLAAVEGSVKGLADGAAPEQLPSLRYDPSRFDAEGKVFFDVVRRPTNAACMGCHSEHRVDGQPRWQHDGDVHLRAGMSCVDCHRNGVDHHMVRGFEGELRPSEEGGVLEPVETLTCRGCHQAGRLGAPELVHAGLPPLHLDELSCTACHAGPAPDGPLIGVQTARAHALGLPDQSRTEQDLPAIAVPVLVRDAGGVLRPMRQFWPTFWGVLRDGEVTPLAPKQVTNPLRRALRIRRALSESLGGDDAEARAAIAKGLAGIAKAMAAELDGAEVVFASGGRLWRQTEDGSVTSFAHAAAEPYRWPLGHDVRPARLAAGAGGCTDCHGEGAPFLHREVMPRGPLVDAAEPPPTTMAVAGLDAELMGAWQQAFTARDVFKWVGFGALGLVLLVVIYELFAALGRAVGWMGRRSAGGER